jgi:hypothetical protein
MSVVNGSIATAQALIPGSDPKQQEMAVCLHCATQMHLPMAPPRARRTADLGGNILRATLPRVPWRSLADVKCPGLCETKPSSSNNQRLKQLPVDDLFVTLGNVTRSKS